MSVSVIWDWYGCEIGPKFGSFRDPCAGKKWWSRVRGENEAYLESSIAVFVFDTKCSGHAVAEGFHGSGGKCYAGEEVRMNVGSVRSIEVEKEGA